MSTFPSTQKSEFVILNPRYIEDGEAPDMLFRVNAGACAQSALQYADALCEAIELVTSDLLANDYDAPRGLMTLINHAATSAGAITASLNDAVQGPREEATGEPDSEVA